MRFATLLCTVLCSITLQADIILIDSVMPKDEQIKTGVASLSPTQKIALEHWINNTFTLKTASTTTTTPLTLSINIDNGKKLELSDNSIWEIAPADISTAAVWITPFTIEITHSNDPNYPYLLTNKLSHASVKAKKIPPSTTQ